MSDADPILAAIADVRPSDLRVLATGVRQLGLSAGALAVALRRGGHVRAGPNHRSPATAFPSSGRPGGAGRVQELGGACLAGGRGGCRTRSWSSRPSSKCTGVAVCKFRVTGTIAVKSERRHPDKAVGMKRRFSHLPARGQFLLLVLPLVALVLIPLVLILIVSWLGT